MSRGATTSAPSSPSASGEEESIPLSFLPKDREQAPQTLISPRELNILRRNADDILDLHRDLTAKLLAIAEHFHLSLDEEPVFDETVQVDAIITAVTSLFVEEVRFS